MVDIVNRMDYRVDVNGIVRTYLSYILKQYVERNNVMSHCFMSAKANVTIGEETEAKEFGFDDQNCHNHIMTSVYLTC